MQAGQLKREIQRALGPVVARVATIVKPVCAPVARIVRATSS
jgi:hypothetical protein